jgi:phospholipid/cholesterol/gamma-HCH transport system substrate-binding protein
MPSLRTQFTVGLFVAIGMALAVFAFIWLGMSRYWDRGRLYATYFDESVQGLNKDSPVKYRGVSIGRVAAIDVAPDSRLIRVLMEIEQDYSLDENLVAQLKAVGITGSMFIEIDRMAGDEIRPSRVLSFPSEYPVIQSKPSEIRRILSGVEDLLQQIKAADLEGVSARTKALLDSAREAIGNIRLKETSDRLAGILGRMEILLSSKAWDGIGPSLSKASANLEIAAAGAASTVEKADKALSCAAKTAEEGSSLVLEALSNAKEAVVDARTLLSQGANLLERAAGAFEGTSSRLVPVLQRLEQAVERLNELAERISQDPSSAIFPQSPRPAKPEELRGGR